MASSTLFTLSILTFSLLLPLTSAISETTISTACESLSTTGFTAMSLTLSLISQTLNLSTLPSATLFSPSDASFFVSSAAGQPSLSLLQLHLSPHRFSATDLRSLSYGTQLPTLLSDKTLIITTRTFSSNQISINGINLTSDSPIFDDGFFAVFAIDRFFNPNFTASVSAPTPNPSFSQCESGPGGSDSYGEVSRALRSGGYSAMAAFLELQLWDSGAATTVFAPTDDAMEGEFGKYSDWARVFRRHIVPCELSSDDLNALDDGSVVSTFLEGFVINVTHSSNALLLNGEITVDFPDYYQGDGVVVHGLSGILSVPDMLGDRGTARGRGLAAYSPGDEIDHAEF